MKLNIFHPLKKLINYLGNAFLITLLTLIFGGTVSVNSPVLAANSAPDIIVTHPIANTIINPGDSLTISGTFTDPDAGQIINIWSTVAGVTKQVDFSPAPYTNQPWSLNWNYDELSNSAAQIPTITVYIQDNAGGENQAILNKSTTVRITPKYIYPNSAFEISAPVQNDPLLMFSGIIVHRHQPANPNSNIAQSYSDEVFIDGENQWVISSDQLASSGGSFILSYDLPEVKKFLYSAADSPELVGTTNNINPNNNTFKLSIEYLYRTPNNLDWRVTGNSIYYAFDLIEPGITVSPLPEINEWYAADFNIAVTATDSESGLRATRYFWGDDSIAELDLLSESQFGANCLSGSASAITAPDATRITLPYTVEEVKTLYICSVDFAGNPKVLKTSPYQLDKTPPTLAITPNDSNFVHTEPTNGTIASVDSLGPVGANSGVVGLRYSWTPSDFAPNCTTGGNFISNDNLPLTFAIPQGENTLYLCSLDNAGNYNSLSQSYKAAYSDNLPEVSHTADGVLYGEGQYADLPIITVDGIASLSGMGAIRYQWDNAFSASSSSPNWVSGSQITFSMPASGIHLLYYEALDNFGIVSEVKGPFVFEVNTSRPTIASELIAPGILGQNGWYTAAPTHRVTVTKNTATVNEFDVTDLGLYRAGSSTNLIDPANYIDLAALGQNYNDHIPAEGITDDFYQGIDNSNSLLSLLGQSVFKVDSASPSGSISYFDGVTKTNSQTISLTATDALPGSGLNKCKLSYRTAFLENSNLSSWSNWQDIADTVNCTDPTYNFTNIPHGFAYQFRYLLEDFAGNQTTINSSSVMTIDTNLPVVLATQSNNVNWYNFSRTPVVTATDSASGIDQARASLDVDFTDATCGDTSGGNLVTDQEQLLIDTEGSHTLYLCARDKASNISTWNGAYKVDLTAPSLNLTSSSNNWYSAARASIVTAADSASGLNDIRYSLDSNNLGANCLGGASIPSGQNIDILLEGDHQLYVCATDKAGNITSTSGQFRIDLTPTQNRIVADHAPEAGGWYTVTDPIISLSAIDPLSATPATSSGLKEYRYHWIAPSASCLTASDNSQSWLQLTGSETVDGSGYTVFRNDVTVPDRGEQVICLQTKDHAGNFTSTSETYRVAGNNPTLSADYIVTPSIGDSTLSSSGWTLFEPTWKVSVLSQDNSPVTKLYYGASSSALNNQVAASGTATLDSFGFGQTGSGYNHIVNLAEGESTYCYQGEVLSSRQSAKDCKTFKIDLYPPAVTFNATRSGSIVNLSTTQSDSGSGLNTCQLNYRWVAYDPDLTDFVIDFTQSPNGWQSITYDCTRNSAALDTIVSNIPNASAIQFKYQVTDIAERSSQLPVSNPNIVNVVNGITDDSQTILNNYNSAPEITIDSAVSGQQIGPNFSFDFNSGLVLSGKFRDTDLGQAQKITMCIPDSNGVDVCKDDESKESDGNWQDYSFSYLGYELGTMTGQSRIAKVTIVDSTSGANSATYSVNLTIYPAAPVAPQEPVVDTSTFVGSDFTATSSGTTAVKANLNIGWVHSQAVADGKIQILFPAAAGAAANDGTGDSEAFDFGGSPTVTCPTDVSGYNFSGAGSAVEPGAIQIDGQNYNVVTCNYTGHGVIGTSFTANPITVNNVINPTTEKSKPVIVRLLDSAGEVIEKQTVLPSLNLGKVKVTAKYQGEITMTVTGVPTGSNACTETTTVGTTPVLIDFGSPTLGDFAIGAQHLEVNSSIMSGYKITVAQQEQMRRIGSAINSCASADGDLAGSQNPDCITDIRHAGASITNPVAYTDPVTQKGLGYSVGLIQSQSGNGITSFASGLYKQLADKNAGESAQNIFTGSSQTDYDRYNVCYKLSIDAAQNAGTYENAIFYTLTAAF